MLFILNKSHEVVGSLNSNGDLSKITTYFDDAYVQDLGTGAETFTFSTMANNEQSQHLVAGNFVAFKEDGEFKLFNIIQIEETHEDTFIKTVYCEMAGIELINEIIRPIKILNSSLRKFLTTILEGTEWQLGKIDAGFTQVFDFESTDYKSAYELIQEYAVGTYGAEISYRVEIEHGRIVGKYIDCYKERGNANGFRFAYGSNLTSVVRTVDMTNLATALIPVGNGGITIKDLDLADKPLGQDFITNEKAYEQWNINGSHIFGVHKADTDSPQELLRLTRIALEERANPQIKYEMKAELLGKDVKIGDTVQVVDHEFNPPLYLSARVNQLTKSKTDPHNDEVVLANFKELNSNITNEMRQLASQLEGYVDSQFPIGGDKIQDGAIGKQQFSKQYHTEIVADAVHASLVETEDLIAGKADIGDLHAINASIENLQAENVDITGKLNATNAVIENLQAENAEITGSLHVTNAKVENLFVDKANITDLNATNAKVDSLQAEKASINQLNATKAEIKELVATKADIDSLTAISGKIDVLESSKANISDLNATNATIGSLQANKADIVELNAVKGNISQLESEVAQIGTLKSDVADIEHILAGNITADNIASGAITAGSSIVANGAIGNAQISSIDASKISAGTIDTSKVTIQGANSHLKIKGNRLQVFQGTGNQAKERVSLGDVNGNGSVYGLRVRGADGQTVLIDENGVTREGITDGSITNDKINEDANIDGSKLNINSVVSKINEDGTETINSTKIDVDGTNLDTKLSSITTKQTEDGEKIAQAQSQIIANTNAIKLKVDNQTYQTDKTNMTSTLNKHTSEISAMQDEIALKVEQADIESVSNALKSEIQTELNEVHERIDGILDNVGGAIADGIIDESETIMINSSITQLNREKETLTQRYNYIYNLSTLESSMKSSLKTAMDNYNSKQSALISHIQSMITDKHISDSERQTYNTRLAEYSTALANINKKIEECMDSISSSKVDSAKAEIKVTTDKISQNVTNLTTTVNNKADGSTVTAINNKVGSLETSVNGISGKVTNLEKVTTNLGNSINGVQGEVDTLKSDVASLEVTTSGISQKVSSVESTTASLSTQFNTLQGEYNNTKSKVASLETNLDGITQRVSSTESTTATLTTKINEVEDVANTSNTNATNALNKANSALTKANSATTEVTKTNQKVASIETNLNGITSRVSNVETKTNTIEGKVNSHESRLTTAESKITDKAIINTVSSTIDQKVNTGIQNVQIGDRNLLLMDNVVNREGVNFSKDGYTVSFTHRAEWQGIQFLNLRETMELGKEYCLQYKIKKVEGTLNGISHHVDAQFEIIDYVVDGKLQNATAHVGNMGMNDTNWHTCTLRVKRKTDATGSDVNRIIPQPNRGSATSVTVEMKDFKISQGNKFGDWSPAPEDVEKQLSDIETMLNGNIDNAISGTKSEILDDVSKNYANKEIVTQLQETVDSKFEQTSTDISMQFNTAQNYTKEVDGKLQDYQNTVATHIRFSENGIDLGKTNSPFSATLDNTKLAFKQSGEEIAYISNNKMYITQTEIKETLRIGTSENGFFSWVQGSEGNLSLKWSES